MYVLCMYTNIICTCRVENILTLGKLLPARASEQGNVIGSVRIYIKKKAFKINAKIEDVGLNED